MSDKEQIIQKRRLEVQETLRKLIIWAEMVLDDMAHGHTRPLTEDEQAEFDRTYGPGTIVLGDYVITPRKETHEDQRT